MKDALGHGSNSRGAHAAGVAQVGRDEYVPIKSIDVSGAKNYIASIQSRHPEIIDSMRQTLRAGKELPPVTLTPEGVLVDGHHRLLASIAEGRTDIRAKRAGAPLR